MPAFQKATAPMSLHIMVLNQSHRYSDFNSTRNAFLCDYRIVRISFRPKQQTLGSGVGRMVIPAESTVTNASVFSFSNVALIA